MNFKAILITAWIWFPALGTAYDTDSDPFLVCDSPECLQRAKLLNESLDTTIDPCTDFYSYVCRRWESNHQSPNFTGSYDVYQESVKDVPEKLSYILGNRSIVESNQTIVDKVAIMYNACLALPDSRGALIKVLSAAGFIDWPFLSEHNIFNSSNCTDLLRHMDISAILSVQIINRGSYSKDPLNPYFMWIRAMPVQYKIKNVPNIAVVINKTIKLLNPEIESSVLQTLTNELEEFAKNLSDITTGISNNKYNTTFLESKFPNIPISNLLKKEFTKVNIAFEDADEFYVDDGNYYRDLNYLLATTNPNTLYNYAGFLVVFSYLEYVQMSNESELTMSKTKSRNWSECINLLDRSARDILDYLYVTDDANHVAIKNEVEGIASRLKQAFNETLQSNSWIDNKTRAALEKKLTEVPLGIGYPDTLLNMSILETRYQYVPVFPLNISFTEALYYIQENLYKMQLRKFRYPKEGDLGWDSSARYGRTFHDDYRMMKMEIPYALFVPPFFQQRLPRSLNYGGIGGAIAHELADSFSYIAIHACEDSDTCTWRITEKSLEFFTNLTSCFVDQYKAANQKMLEVLDDNYNENTSAEAHEYEAFFELSRKEEYDCCYYEALEERYRMSKVKRQTEGEDSGSNNDNTTQESSGTRDEAMEKCLAYWQEYYRKKDEYRSRELFIYWRKTLNEDIADNIGLQTAFKAYNNVLQEECAGLDTRLAGLENVTGMQLFFILNARTQCRIADKATLVKEIRTAEYSTAQNRVNEAMKNLKGFAEAFNCSLRSPMNPNERCSLW